MFYLVDPDMNPANIFPKNLDRRLCAKFCCKGKECSSENCGFEHISKERDLSQEDIKKICQHFKNNKTGWLNKNSFRHVTLEEQFTFLLSLEDSPFST